MTKKELIEQRNALIAQMQAIADAADAEKRCLTDDEAKNFEELRAKIGEIDNTIRAQDQLRTFDTEVPAAGSGEGEPRTANEQRTLDEQNFLSFIRSGGRQERALDVGTNGGIIPTTIADRIIEEVRELSPILSMVTFYNVGGDLVFPLWTDTKDEGNTLKAAYVDDMQTLTATAGKFTTIKLENYIAGVLTLVSKSLMNRSDFDLLSFIIHKTAEKIAEFLEHECIVGTSGKMTGVISATAGVTAASQTVITADELIDLEMSIPESYQSRACFIMHKDTLKALRKLKNQQNEYLLNKDLTSAYKWTLLGHPVYISENMPLISAGNKAIVYGDMSGLYLKFAQGIETQALVEKYADQHAVGVIAYVEADSKIVEQQKLRTLEMAGAVQQEENNG